ncbi:MAG TPA: PfkB family carbohydrate kinase [Anaerolineae bacterium]|nr:PfkB family carbohydrate kinase [Anaerolineae bacterium]
MYSTRPTLDLLVIGGASLDVYHLANGETVRSPGGAGLYTALAAACSGARTGMFAPRPDPMPAPLITATERLEWLGPIVPPDQLPSFEIAHYGGGRAALLNASWGGEMLITPETFPGEHVQSAIIHIAALRTAERQLNFAKRLNTDLRGFEYLGGLTRVSAGTYGKICASEPDTVRELIRLCDFFFMNENEANLLFGGVANIKARPGQIVFVTLAERGAVVIQGDHVTQVAGHPADDLDPTGAGDTFCGATLAHIARGQHPAMAAQAAVRLSAEMIGAVGPTRLLSDDPAPAPALDPHVRVDNAQVQRIAQLIAHLPEVQPFRFVGDFFPYVDDPGALDWFFAVTLQQFGFWDVAPRPVGEGPGVRVYSHPMIATLDGRSLKGSDYLFAAYRRMIDRDSGFFTPDRQAALTTEELAAALRADDGSNPMPAFDLHVQLAQAYGRDMQALAWTPRTLIDTANASAQPRRTFLSLLDHVGGYKEDPLRKKAMLLALILEQRPEKFLRPAPGEAEPPVIDYHLMRSCLRTGLVDVVDDKLRERLIGREELSVEEEWGVRFAAYQAIQQVQAQSGRSMGAVDWFFFNARRRCPEMTEPECANCAIDAVCAHRKELFQPVIRTTFY